MSDPQYLGTNDIGLPVWQINEGGMRPMLMDDGSGRIQCSHCGEREIPGRITLKMPPGASWAVLYCPECTMAHCIMRVVTGHLAAPQGNVEPRSACKCGGEVVHPGLGLCGPCVQGLANKLAEDSQSKIPPCDVEGCDELGIIAFGLSGVSLCEGHYDAFPQAPPDPHHEQRCYVDAGGCEHPIRELSEPGETVLISISEGGARYSTRVYREGDDWVASVVTLPGCIGVGDTQHEAIKAVRGFIRNWIEVADERRRADASPETEGHAV